tara:strand:+ start:492 stop:608 length:117 start_codon:yes stop_codon:yes gene_type:complete
VNEDVTITDSTGGDVIVDLGPVDVRRTVAGKNGVISSG